MKLGIISNKSSIEYINAMIEYAKIKNVEIVNYEYETYSAIQQIVMTAQREADTLLFGGKAVYKLAYSKIDPSIPWEFIDRSEASFLKGFVEALQKGYGMSKITIDSCDEERYEKLLISYEDINIKNKKIYNIDLEVTEPEFLSSEYIKQLCDCHRKFYEDGDVTCCFTCYDNVFEQLKKWKIPVVMFDYTIDETIEKVMRLKLIYSYNLSKQNQIVAISIEIDLPHEQSIMNNDIYHLEIKKMEVLKEVYVFAEKLQAALNISEDMTNIILFTTKSLVNIETKNLTQLNFLKTVRLKTMFTTSVGIGYGKNAKEAKNNAVEGKNKAKKVGGDCAYVVYERSKISGPIYGAKDISVKKEAVDEKLSEISGKTNISEKNLLKLIKIKEQYALDIVTSKQLADLYGFSLRGMNKMLAKLEDAGYVKIVGTAMYNDRGRPYRLIKLRL